jgi:3-oxoacyl-(acyl-carrier-protein) synthase
MASLFWVMDKLVISAVSAVTDADLPKAKMGSRFGRMDLLSQLALLSIESLAIDFETLDRSRIGVCMAVRAGSLTTDIEYWKGRNNTGGPSPTLFAYTLPSSAIGEIAIRYRLTGPNLCFVGTDAMLLAEARDLVERREADACLCVACNVITPAASELIGVPPKAQVRAAFLARGTNGIFLEENHRDMDSVWALVCAGDIARQSSR